MSPVGATLVPSPPKTRRNLLHPRPPPIVERVVRALILCWREKNEKMKPTNTIEDNIKTMYSSVSRQARLSDEVHRGNVSLVSH